MINKTELLQAIDSCDIYAKGQKNILKTLVLVSVDGIAEVSCSYLAEKTGLKRSTIYLHLSAFDKVGYISRISYAHNTPDTFKLNWNQLDFFIKLHNNKENLKNQLNNLNK